MEAYPKTYIRGFTDLTKIVETMRRVDVQNTVENREFSFMYSMEVDEYGYYLVVTVFKIHGENNRSIS